MSTSSPPVEFYNGVFTRFTEACDQGNSEHIKIDIGGNLIDLHFANPTLKKWILPAFRYFVTAEWSEPDLTICIWDSVSTNIDQLPPAWEETSFSIRAEIKNFSSEQIFTAYHLGANSLSLLDKENKQAIFWVRDPNYFPDYEMAVPLRIIFHWWMSLRDILLVHSAAVGHRDGGVLITGKSGSGKSSTALACLFSDLLYAADDSCLVQENKPVTVLSLYNVAKKNLSSVDLKSQLAQSALASRSNDEKVIFQVFDEFPGKLVKSFPLKAILVPKITHRRNTTYREISPIKALSELAPTTILQLPGSGKNILNRLSTITQSVANYSLGVGTDLEQIPETINQILRTL